MKTLSYREAKSENRRVKVYLVEGKNGHVVVVQTKRLLDKKKREFAETEEYYTIETATMIRATLDNMLEDNAERILKAREGKLQEIFITKYADEK